VATCGGHELSIIVSVKLLPGHKKEKKFYEQNVKEKNIMYKLSLAV